MISSAAPISRLSLVFTVWRRRMHIPVLDMAAVFPQMNDNTRSPGQFADAGGQHRVRFVNASGLSQGGNVIDVYGKLDHFFPSR